MNSFYKLHTGAQAPNLQGKGILGNKELTILCHPKHSNKYEHRHGYNNIDIVIWMAMCQ